MERRTDGRDKRKRKKGTRNKAKEGTAGETQTRTKRAEGKGGTEGEGTARKRRGNNEATGNIKERVLGFLSSIVCEVDKLGVK